MMRPRWYQNEARAAVWDHIRHHDTNPCIVLPTGSGKTIVIAELARDVVNWGGRVAILAHRKELLQQAEEKLMAIAPDLPVGVYSAGLNRRELDAPIVIAGIASIYQRACELGSRDVMIIDEAHLIPLDDNSMYQTFLDDAKVVNPSMRVVGLTATPYRLKDGFVGQPGHWLNEVVFEAPIPRLIAEGFLSPLTSKAATAQLDTSALHVRGGEFVPSEVNDLCDDAEIVKTAVGEVIAKAHDRKSILVFCSGRSHASHVRDAFVARGIDAAYLDGETLPNVRAEILDDFKSGRVRVLVNIDVLTTGFDAPNVDCVAILRPTLSPGLYSQMVGRGLRIAPGKTNCLVLDFGGNIERHGPIDRVTVAPRTASGSGSGEPVAKTCQQCREVVPCGVKTCPECGHEFPVADVSHDTKASTASILQEEPPEWEKVQETKYYVHTKRGATPGDGTPQTMRVEYRTGLSSAVSEWVCVEHGGYALEKALKWWGTRSTLEMPNTAEEAVALAMAGNLAEPDEILVGKENGFNRVFDYRLGPIPDPTSFDIDVLETLPPFEEKELIDYDDLPF